jgi:hypothetical protein
MSKVRTEDSREGLRGLDKDRRSVARWQCQKSVRRKTMGGLRHFDRKRGGFASWQCQKCAGRHHGRLALP